MNELMKITKGMERTFDRMPYCFKKVNEKGITETYFSIEGKKAEFRFLYGDSEDSYFTTEVIKDTGNAAVVKCSVYINGKLRATAHASRYFNHRTILGMRYLECAETAAIGRALGNLGIGEGMKTEENEGFLSSPAVEFGGEEDDIERTLLAGGEDLNGNTENINQAPKTEKKAFEDIIKDSIDEAEEDEFKNDSSSEDVEFLKYTSKEAMRTVIKSNKELAGVPFSALLVKFKDMREYIKVLESIVSSSEYTIEERSAAYAILPNVVKSLNTKN